MGALRDEIAALRQEVSALRNDLQRLAGARVQVVGGLSDISGTLGLVTAGEMRAGNGATPGSGFTGVRIGYPAFSYGGETYHIVGVNSDVLQFALRATDGKAIFGGGNVTLDKDGLSVKNNTDSILFWDTSGEPAGRIRMNNSNDLEIWAYGNGDEIYIRPVTQTHFTGQGSGVIASIRKDPTLVTRNQMNVGIDTSGGRYTIGGRVILDTDGDDVSLALNAENSPASDSYISWEHDTLYLWLSGVDGSDANKLKFAVNNTGSWQALGTATDVLLLDMNRNVVIGAAALATNATDGFLHIPTCAGAPTGTPTSYTGRVPLIYDTSNQRLYVYSGGWRYAATT